ncbi:MAG: hydrogenase formation protein HypD [Methanosarcinaceae archaeon]|nr:hydrogenase formation protein HypD [Methanosarcinaceae archaeon]
MVVDIEKKLIASITKHARPLRIMHICGTHERTISKYGLRGVLPPEVEVLSGPGCPVCVTPTEDIDFAITLANAGVMLVSFGDMMRVPGNSGNLLDAKAKGADVRMAYSIDDAVTLANNNPEKEVVFFGIGFETTAPANAAAVLRGLPENFSILTSHKLVPPAMDLLIKDINVDAFIAPGHVTTIIGMHPYQPIADMGFPIVIAGFEVRDVLLSIAMIQRQVEAGVSKVENAYPRAVNEEGNITAQEMMQQVFDVADSNWRGIGVIKNSGLCLKTKFRHYDATKRYAKEYQNMLDSTPVNTVSSRCMCAAILTAKAQPSQCPMFGKDCTPKNPVGPCMVSLEGMCYNWYKYSREK